MLSCPFCNELLTSEVCDGCDSTASEIRNETKNVIIEAIKNLYLEASYTENTQLQTQKYLEEIKRKIQTYKDLITHTATLQPNTNDKYKFRTGRISECASLVVASSSDKTCIGKRNSLVCAEGINCSDEEFVAWLSIIYNDVIEEVAGTFIALKNNNSILKASSKEIKLHIHDFLNTRKKLTPGGL